MRIVIFGAGNVAAILGRLMSSTGHVIAQVVNRNPVSAAALAADLENRSGSAVSFTGDIAQLDRSADLYLLAIPDNAIQGASAWLQLDRQLVAHTAGALSMEPLKGISSNYGVLYPLQSLRKEMERIPSIPFLVNGNSTENIAVLSGLAKELSPNVQTVDDDTRLKLHLSAIIVNNFTNHLFTLAEDYCKEEGLDFSMLTPLISEVAGRLQDESPRNLQTGPAIRHDHSTIEKHLEALTAHPRLLQLYTMLTKSIEAYYPKK